MGELHQQECDQVSDDGAELPEQTEVAGEVLGVVAVGDTAFDPDVKQGNQVAPREVVREEQRLPPGIVQRSEC